MAKKVILTVLSVLTALCLFCCVYLFFFDRGKDGRDGADGKDGQNGTDGVDGADGSRWYVGEGIPAPDYGKVGDCYFDLESNSLYQKSANGWDSYGKLHQEPVPVEDITVFFDAAEGTLPSGKDTYLVPKGTSLVLPIPERAGFDFVGWFFGEGVNAAQANDLTVFTADITLVARWKKQNAIELQTSEATGQVDKTVRFGGTYNGSAPIVVFLERDGSLLNLTDAEKLGWIGSHQFNGSTDGTGSFDGYLQFTETGEYTLIFRAAEPDGTVEARMHITINR